MDGEASVSNLLRKENFRPHKYRGCLSFLQFQILRKLKAGPAYILNSIQGWKIQAWRKKLKTHDSYLGKLAENTVCLGRYARA
jgi:hypothetical protein